VIWANQLDALNAGGSTFTSPAGHHQRSRRYPRVDHRPRALLRVPTL